jgi:hypothetical protein
MTVLEGDESSLTGNIAAAGAKSSPGPRAAFVLAAAAATG